MVMTKVDYAKKHRETNNGIVLCTVVNPEKKRLGFIFLEIKQEYKSHPPFSFGFSILPWFKSLLLQRLVHMLNFKHISCHTELSAFKHRNKS